MHLTIDSQKITLNLHNNDPSVSQIMDSKSVVTQLENPVLSAKKEPQKKETLTFRNNQGEEPSPSRQMNSPRGNRNESSNPQYQILQNMKSPYFLRKGWSLFRFVLLQLLSDDALALRFKNVLGLLLNQILNFLSFQLLLLFFITKKS